jgi:hypothetical protein
MRRHDDSFQTHFQNTCGMCCPLLVSDPDAAATAFQCLEGDVEGGRRGRRTRRVYESSTGKGAGGGLLGLLWLLWLRAAASQQAPQVFLTHFLFLQKPVDDDFPCWFW